ncbi:MAG: Uma2 family endonuclease, partial [Acetobacteraceae bacterium]
GSRLYDGVGGVSIERRRAMVRGMVALVKRPPARMTVDEFLEWDTGDNSGARWQLIDGELVAMAPASQPHGAILIEFGRLLANHLLNKGSPCRVIGEPGIIPHVRAKQNFRIPDLGVTCSPDATGIMVPEPVLLIEIMSPSNEAETWANIWSYTTIPSVREILIVHSTRIEAELLRRRDDENWPETPEIIHPPAALRLASIGFSAPLAALYRTTALAER